MFRDQGVGGSNPLSPTTSFRKARDSKQMATASGISRILVADASGDSAADMLVPRQHLQRKIGQSCRRRPSRSYRAQQYARHIFLSSSHGEELFCRPHEPVPSITGPKPPFEQRFEYARCAMWVVPDQMLGVELRPVCFKNAITGIEFMPHFRLWMRRDDGDLRDIEF